MHSSKLSHIIAPDTQGDYWVLGVPHGYRAHIAPFTVAVVGNAQSLFDTAYGSDIDSHDVVIRMNRAVNVTNTVSGAEISHGIRTDIWCTWRHQEYENASVTAPRSVCQMMWWDCEPQLPVHHIHTGWFVTHTVPWTPSTGIMTLAWLYTLPCTVSVYGFDFKATPTYTDPQRNCEQTGIHNFAQEQRLCTNIFAQSGRYRFCN